MYLSVFIPMYSRISVFDFGSEQNDNNLASSPASSLAKNYRSRIRQFDQIRISLNYHSAFLEEVCIRQTISNCFSDCLMFRCFLYSIRIFQHKRNFEILCQLFVDRHKEVMLTFFELFSVLNKSVFSFDTSLRPVVYQLWSSFSATPSIITPPYVLHMDE